MLAGPVTLRFGIGHSPGGLAEEQTIFIRAQRVLGDYETPPRIIPWCIFETKVPFYHQAKQVRTNKDTLLSDEGR